MFRLFRFFAVVSLFVLAFGALALSILYRQSAVQELLRVEQDKNVVLTRAFANTLWPEFSILLDNAANLNDEELRASPVVQQLDAALRQQMTDLSIVKVKIYGLDGRTLYSSQPSQIGENQAQNAGLQAAAAGQIINELTHRDEFNSLDGIIENRDVLASYLPLRESARGNVEAIFELYSDVTPLLAEIDRVQWQISGGVILILSILYATLLSVVLYAQRIIREQYAERVRADLALRRQNQYLTTLHQTGLAVLDRRALDVTLNDILSQACQITQTAHGLIGIRQESGEIGIAGGVGVFSALRGETMALPQAIERDLDAAEKARMFDKSVIQGHDWEVALPDDTVAFLALPLHSHNQLLGVFLLFSTSGAAVQPEEIDLLAGYAQVAALAIDNAALYQNVQSELAERMRTEATLAASEERMRTLVQSMREVVFTVDRSGCYTGFYGRALTEYGIDPDLAVGKTPAELFDPVVAQLHADAIRRGLDNEYVVFDWESITGDGRTIYLQTALSPVLNGGGAVIGLVGVGRDYSELKRLEQVKTEFVANVSHELRTPLASILGYTEIVLQGRPGPLTPIQREFLQTIFDSGKRLKLLVDDLLDVSKIEVGKFRMQFDEVDVMGCTLQAVEAIQPAAARSGITVSVSAPEGDTFIEADAQRIGQVLDNLLSNAVKFSGQDGCVTVTIGSDDHDVSIAVADSGIGIAAEDIPHLFARFYRTSSADAAKRSGTGLGLYISKAIVDAHGGRINVESEPGHGCVFRIWLPKTQESKPEMSHAVMHSPT